MGESLTSTGITPAHAEDHACLWLRAATAADQATIRARVRDAQLNPLHLDWSHFVVVEDARQGEIVVVGQLRPHGTFSEKPVLELASIAVSSQWQGHGIGAVIVQTLVARASGPLYLFCRGEMAAYYTRFGFRVARAAELPDALAWQLRIGQVLLGALNWINRRVAGRILLPILGRRSHSRRPLQVVAMLRTS